MVQTGRLKQPRKIPIVKCYLSLIIENDKQQRNFTDFKCRILIFVC